MNPLSPNFFRLALLGAAGVMLGHSLVVANVLNGGFDAVTGNQANHWSSTAVPPGASTTGTIRGGIEGGFGWTSGYFTGGFPTGNTFASTVIGPVRQDLAGAGSTFSEGVTYTLTVDLFSSDTYSVSAGAAIMWSLALTADGTPVAQDHWFSDEFADSTVGDGNGGTIPDNRIINIVLNSGTGLTTATLTYTATAADDGKTIGVQLGGDSQSLYTLAASAPVPDDRFGMMDNVILVNDAVATLIAFTPSTTVVDGNPITLSWEVNGVNVANSLTLDDGSGPVDALPLTDGVTGIGSTSINPTADTTYTITLNGTQSLQIALASSIVAFSSDAQVIDGFPITMSWEIRNPRLISTVTLDDGNGPVNVLADTDTLTGLGSVAVNPTNNTTYTLTLNGSTTRTRNIFAGEVLGFTTSAVVAKLPAHEVTLSWEISPPDGSVTISDGTNTIDATSNTDPATGIGSQVVSVPDPSTNFELSANGGANVRRVRVFRETVNSDALSLNQSAITTDGSLTVTWSGAVAGPTDWIGIYRIGNTPGPVGSTQWNYLNGTRTPGVGPASGSMTFTGLGVGEYFAVLLLNDGYTLAQGPIVFAVTLPPPSEPAIIRVVSATRSGDEFTIAWESKAGFEYDIFASDSLEGDPLEDWEDLEFAYPSGGNGTTSYTEDLSLIPGGPPQRRFYRIYEFGVQP